jgi:hypothetical protein
MPVATHIFTAICRNTLTPLDAVKNLSDNKPKTMHKIISAIND